MASTPQDPAARALRLELALEAGLVLPEGRVALLHPGPAETLPDLPRERLLAVTPHATAHDALKAQGVEVRQGDPEPGSMGAVLVCLPRARAEAQDLVARAARLTGGPVIVDGQKTDGIEPLLKALRARVALSEVLSKGHGKLAWFTAAPLDDWRAEPGAVTAEDGARFTTLPGIFSAAEVDPASKLLAGALPEGAKGVAVDLGAGWGYLAARFLARAPALTALHLVESDARALDCARLNVTDPRAAFHWADATRPLPGLRADHVVMNPPFHRGRAGDPEMGAAFIGAAAALLKPSGALWMVANRHLPYEAALRAAFREVEEIGGTPTFKLFRATAAHTPQSRRALQRRR